MARGRALPDGAAQMRPELRQALHPVQRQRAQGAQFFGLRVGTEQGNVLADGFVQQSLVGQRGARGGAQQLQRAALGTAQFEAIFDHKTRGGAGDLQRKRRFGDWHGAIVARCADRTQGAVLGLPRSALAMALWSPKNY